MNIDIPALVRAVQHVMATAPLAPQVLRRDLAVAHDFDPLSLDAVTAFERRLTALVGAKHAVAVSSGTAALHLILRALGIGQHNRVAVPALTFVATANAVRYCGGQPVFIDASREHGGLSMDSLTRNGTIKSVSAVIGVDLFGHPGGMSDLELFCGYHGVPLIEDACQALGAREGSRACGTFGDAAAISFNVNKIVTTGGGGAVLTEDARIAERVRFLAAQAKDCGNPWGWDHLEVGYNYRMPPVCAALGYAQLGHLGGLLDGRRALAHRYMAALEDVQGVEFVAEPAGTVSNYWMPHIRLSPLLGESAMGVRDQILLALHQAGCTARASFTPLTELPPYRALSLRRPHVARELYARTVCLPVR